MFLLYNQYAKQNFKGNGNKKEGVELSLFSPVLMNGLITFNFNLPLQKMKQKMFVCSFYLKKSWGALTSWNCTH